MHIIYNKAKTDIAFENIKFYLLCLPQVFNLNMLTKILTKSGKPILRKLDFLV